MIKSSDFFRLFEIISPLNFLFEQFKIDFNYNTSLMANTKSRS
jgi:hypothetical protein